MILICIILISNSILYRGEYNLGKNAIIYCTDKKYIGQTASSICSVLENYKEGKELSILVMGEGLNNLEVEILRELPTWFNRNKVEVSVWMPPVALKRVNKFYNKYFSKITLWCLFIPGYFNSCEKILFLDSDTLVYDDVDNIFNACSDENPIAAVRDFYISMVTGTSNVEAYPEIKEPEKYCNSGVILFNVEKYNQALHEDELVSLCNTDRYVFPDQTIINDFS